MKPAKRKQLITRGSEPSAPGGLQATKDEAFSWTRFAIYEIALFALLVVWAVTLPVFRKMPYGLPVTGLAGLAALACSRIVYPRDAVKAHELALADGIAAFLLIRPWVDGITFPQYNVYFFWYAVVLFLIVATEGLFRKDTPRSKPLVLLKCGFLLIAALGLFWSIQVDNSFRGWVNWIGFFFLFLVANRAGQSKLALGVILAAFVCAGLAESLYAVWHLKYQIPQIRAIVERSPEILLQQAGRSVNRDELMHRLYTNRAFGSFLFANALAAFLILVIPVAVGIVVDRVRQLRLWEAARKLTGDAHEGRHAPAEFPPAFSGKSVEDAGAGAILTWVVVTAFSVGAVFLFLVQIAPQFQTVWTRLLTWLIPAVLPLFFAVGAYHVVRRKGLGTLWLRAQIGLAACGAFAAIYGLVLTISRGGILALLMSAAITCSILGRKAFKPLLLSNKTRILVFLLTVLLLGGMFAESIASLGHVYAAASPGETASAPPTNQSSIQGRAVSPAELLSPLTFALRVGYWKVGLRILKEYWLGGVGLNNFGVIYPRYQFLGAGDVRQAHNDYLQVFCETGISGFMLFCAFWVGVVLIGLRVITTHRDGGTKILSAGLFSGVLAFLLHSFVDFNFYNPSLASFQYILAGLLVAGLQDESRGKMTPLRPFPEGGKRFVWTVSIVIATGLAFYAGRLRAVDQIVSDPSVANARLNAAGFLLKMCHPESKQPLDQRIPYRVIKALVGNDTTASTFGKMVGIPRQLGDVVPSPQGKGANTGLEEFVITDKARAYEVAKFAADFWLENAKRADRAYPHSPELATHIFQWYDLFASLESTSAKRLTHMEQCLYWIRELVKRSPMQAVNHELLGRILWIRASMEDSPRRAEMYRQAIEAYRHAANLYPTSREIWTRYGEKVVQYGKALEQATDESLRKDAVKYLEEGKKAMEYAEGLPSRE